MPIAQIDFHSKTSPASNADTLSMCIFYRKESCSTNKIKFAICRKCHRSKVITLENAVPRMFERIIALANMLIKLLGLTPNK